MAYNLACWCIQMAYTQHSWMLMDIVVGLSVRPSVRLFVYGIFRWLCICWQITWNKWHKIWHDDVVIIGRWLLPSLVDMGDICCHYWQLILVVVGIYSVLGARFMGNWSRDLVTFPNDVSTWLVGVSIWLVGDLGRWKEDYMWSLGVENDVNTLRQRQNGRHFADDTFKCIFMNENVRISINISLKFVPEGLINNISALVWIMAWHRPGNKPFSEPMMVNLLTHIYASLGLNELNPINHQLVTTYDCAMCHTSPYHWWWYDDDDNDDDEKMIMMTRRRRRGKNNIVKPLI